MLNLQPIINSSHAPDWWNSPEYVRELLRRYGVQTPAYVVVQSEHDVLNLNLSFPVALKVCSATILHKSDVGGVVLNIEDRTMLLEEYKRMLQRFGNETLLVEEMVEQGLEIIIGIVHDKIFGPCIMLGLGGIFAEVLNDGVFRGDSHYRCRR